MPETAPETIRALSRGVHPQRILRGPVLAVVDALEAGLIEPTAQLATDLELHRRALRADRAAKAHRAARPGLQAAQAAVWARLESGHDVSDVDLDQLCEAAADDAVANAATNTTAEWVLSTGSAVAMQVDLDVDELIATGVRPLLASLNRSWQPLVEALEDRDPRRPELFVGLDDDAGREAMHGAREIAARLKVVRALYRALVGVRVTDRPFGALERAGIFDRPTGGPVQGDALDVLVEAGVQPQWAPSVSELTAAAAGPSQVLTDEREIERIRREHAAARAAQSAARPLAQPSPRPPQPVAT